MSETWAGRPFDLVLFGATGFTGALVAQVLQATAARPGEPPLRWALAGRSLARLDAVRQRIAAGADLPLIAADAGDATALAALVRRTRAVVTTVGPYQRHGEPLLAACAAAGTDYLDLCGEPAWMARMIERHQATAQASGARIVFSCDFDSIPFDLGVVYLQDLARQRFGSPLARVDGLVKVMKGAASGGTVASLLATLEAMAADPAQARLMADPFSLTPGFRGPAQPESHAAEYDAQARSWTVPFIMAAINTKNVHRTHALRGHPWGRDFVYSERQTTGDGPGGRARAHALAQAFRLQNLLLGFAPSRALLRAWVLPRPGQGPGRAQREAGRYELHFLGRTADGVGSLGASVSGAGDPG